MNDHSEIRANGVHVDVICKLSQFKSLSPCLAKFSVTIHIFLKKHFKPKTLLTYKRFNL